MTRLACNAHDNGRQCLAGLFFDEHEFVDGRFVHPLIDEDEDEA